ncbi:MAG TPA: V-type ATPase subunit, partial [Nitrospirota bacterium]|nr:V-type ATPase subunit [Nitrospirota bacterium]
MYNGELLDLLDDRGYPVDYLYARIRGRRSRLIMDWKAFVYEASPLEILSGGASRGVVRDRTAEGIWVNLLREYRWVCRQMNSGLRDIFAPYFLYAELRTLFISLRHIKESSTEETADLLSQSLLSKRIKNILETSKKPEVAVTALERAFLTLSTSFSGIAGSFEKDGLRGFEQDLTNRYLAHIVNRGLHPLVRIFFSRIIDARNILALYKALRMSARARPVFLPGGAMTSERFRDILKSKDLFTVKSLVREATGIRIDSP